MLWPVLDVIWHAKYPLETDREKEFCEKAVKSQMQAVWHGIFQK